jgi:magnesium transporter
MAEILEGLGAAERDRIDALRRDERFFWVDLCVDEVGPEQIAEALRIHAPALDPLLDFGHQTPPSRKFHADGEHVVFPFNAFVETDAVDDVVARLDPIEVHVLVHGDYMLTLHREPLSLPRILSGYTPEGRSEQYVVYAVLDAMIATAFDALNNVQLAIEGLQAFSTELGNARVRMGTLRAINVRLSRMRRQIGPQQGIFERISEEIGQVEGLEADSERYFDRIHDQLRRLIDGIDATGDAMAKLIDLRLNETIYWLTVVATIFLPLTFVTGFFGMNFGWMVGHIDTLGTFLLLGVGVPAAATVVTYLLIQRRTPVKPDQSGIERAVSALRPPPS